MHVLRLFRPTYNLGCQTCKHKTAQPSGGSNRHLCSSKESSEGCRILLRLFGASAYQYRKRWDLAIDAFCRGSTPTLTPGGLRAGSAVYHYKMGKPIADLMWLMRLRSQTTVESYLQEVAALNVLATMPSECRNAILAAASTFPYLIAGCLSGRGSSWEWQSNLVCAGLVTWPAPCSNGWTLPMQSSSCCSTTCWMWLLQCSGVLCLALRLRHDLSINVATTRASMGARKR